MFLIFIVLVKASEDVHVTCTCLKKNYIKIIGLHQTRSTCWCPSPASFPSPWQWRAGHLQESFGVTAYLVPASNTSPLNCNLERTKQDVPVIILTMTPRLSALLMVSALSCRGRSNSGRSATNCHGLPGLSLRFSGTSCDAT